jgi:hypothetical protein
MATSDQTTTLKLENGDSITYKSITEDELASLTQGNDHKILDVYMKSGVYVFQAHDGLLYINDRGTCAIFNDIKDLNAYVGKRSREKGSNEIMFGRNPFGENFPKKISDLIKEIKEVLNINSTGINEQLLIDIDDAINLREDKAEFREKYFLNQVAVIGELFIKEHQPTAAWKMQLATDFTSWEPNLTYKNQGLVFFDYLYEDFFINKEIPPHPLLEIYRTIDDIGRMNR